MFKDITFLFKVLQHQRNNSCKIIPLALHYHSPMYIDTNKLRPVKILDSEIEYYIPELHPNWKFTVSLKLVNDCLNNDIDLFFSSNK